MPIIAGAGDEALKPETHGAEVILGAALPSLALNRVQASLPN